jgi:hypothetical protein
MIPSGQITIADEMTVSGTGQLAGKVLEILIDDRKTETR